MTHSETERLRELELQHYQLDDDIKALNIQIEVLGKQSVERIEILIEDKAAKKRQLKIVNDEADRLRRCIKTLKEGQA